jgi:uronate dehydrogenase
VLWTSLDDLVELLRRSLVTPAVGHTIAFGVSDNEGKWWDDRHSRHLGFVAKDSSSKFAHVVQGRVDYSANEDITVTYQGGAFLNNGPKYPK